MGRRVLITGGAGFIGSHVADALLTAGYEVRALDSLVEQVHGTAADRPRYLNANVELVHGDVRDRETVLRALRSVDAVFHFAARVGVGQSMYEAEAYTSVNNVGTAVLLEALAERPVERLVTASSMSIYGEGLYRTRKGRIVADAERHPARLREGDFELRDDDGEPLEPIPTPEWKPPALASVYALSKYDQERMSLVMGRAYRIPVVALRFFNVYGPRQALSNPYTGVLAIFASRLMNGRAPMVFEDGRQRRDFVSVHDVASACVKALTASGAKDRVLNVGSGRSYSVSEIAGRVAKAVGRESIAPEVTRKVRVGDVRHCFADVAEAQAALGWTPRVTLEDGLSELAGWLDGQGATDRVDEMARELERRGLTV